MKMTVISGKGGTGKTTIAMGIADLEQNTVKVDCDVDAPNLYLYFSDGKNLKKDIFYGGKMAVVDESLCAKCGECQLVCQFEAVVDGVIDSFSCEGCGACSLVCPEDAIRLDDEKGADVYLTEVDKGIISHARMEIGSEGSGKLVTQLRKNARDFAGDDILTINDGSPGVGCPVIASITDNDAVMVVAEPTKSGLSDFVRIVELCNHFQLLTFVCINKADLNEEVAAEIEEFCVENDLPLVGKIPYDETVVESINSLKPITQYSESIADKEIRKMWKNIENQLLRRGIVK